MPNNYGNSVVSVVNAYNTVAPINSNTTLNANSYNRAYTITGAYAVTLPLISTGVATNFILFINDTPASTAVISAQGADAIRVVGAGVATISLLPGDTVLLEHNGASWSIANNSYAKANVNSPTFSGVPVAPTAGAGTSTSQLATTQFVQTALSSFSAVPVGSIIMTLGVSAPAGTLKLNGAVISRTTYTNLFSVIGISYGAGDGSTTFGLPDFRGYFPRFTDDGRGVDPGRGIGSVQADLNLAHTHPVNDPSHAHGVGDPGHAHSAYVSDPGHNHTYWSNAAAYVQYGPQGSWYASGTSGGGVSYSGTGISVGIYGAGTGIGIYGAYTGISLANAGGTESRPKNIAVLACIKF